MMVNNPGEYVILQCKVNNKSSFVLLYIWNSIGGVTVSVLASGRSWVRGQVWSNQRL